MEGWWKAKEVWASVVMKVNGDLSPTGIDQGFLQKGWSSVQARKLGEPE